ncbi:MAG TPA: histidine phosphatase family protein [Candidatus Saccharimonadales bacterium]|nr:histidine phosphatase family protein [Candidatus Saccharimonadales bacterium]
MIHLYFIRHGQSELNAREIFAGCLDTPLTKRGCQQAAAAGEQAKAVSFDLIVSSPLVRALETAQIVAQEAGYPLDAIRQSDLFKERSLGKLEGKPWTTYDESADHDLASDKAMGVEPMAELVERARKGLVFLQNQPAETILVVGHGSFYRALCTALDPSQSYDEPPNTQIIQLV